MKVAVVIPAYNEAKHIHSVLQSIPPSIDTHPISVIVVDDGSTDETSGISRACGAHVISHLINRGQGAALKSGFDYALLSGADIVVSFDADGQHCAQEIQTMIQPIISEEVKVVLGSRFLSQKPQNLPYIRFLILRGGTLFTRILSRIKVTDTHNGFRAFHASAIAKIIIKEDKMEHASEILDQISALKLPYKEVPVTIAYTEYSLKKGQSNSNALKIAVKLMLLKLR